MMRVIARLRLGRLRTLAPLTALVIGWPLHHDPVGKRATGYAGVLPIPAPRSAAKLLRLDSLLEMRHDTRAERGRVLYSPGRGPHDSASAPMHSAGRRVCSGQHLDQTPRPSSAPNL